MTDKEICYSFIQKNEAKIDVLQLSCSKFYGEPAEPLLRSNVTRDLDTLDPLVNALQMAN